MKKLLIVCMLITGCSDMQTAWKIGSVPESELATIERSVFNKPCELKRKQLECPLPDISSTLCADKYHQANATFYGANTIVDEAGVKSYFYCAPGLPLFKGPYDNAWLIKHDNRAEGATYKDYQQAGEQCDYEAHKATVNTSPSVPTPAFLPTGSYALNQYQINNMQNARMQRLYDEINLDSERISLRRQCLKAKGFIVTRNSYKADFDDLKKFCPDIDNLLEPCFIPDTIK